MKKGTHKLEEYLLNIWYPILVRPDETTDGGTCFVAMHPDLPGCFAHGDTIEEAIENLREAKVLYIKTLLEKGVEVPLPRMRPTVIWEIVENAGIS